MKQFNYKDITRINESSNATVAHLVPDNTKSLSELCGPCAVIDLSKIETISPHGLQAAFDDFQAKLDAALIPGLVNSKEPVEIKRWLIKTRTKNSEEKKARVTQSCVEFFKQNGSVFVGFDCPVDSTLVQAFSSVKIPTIVNLDLEDLSGNDRGMLLCGPLLIEGEQSVPCRVLVLV